MTSPNLRKDIFVGMPVRIAILKSDTYEKWISSEVKEILTNIDEEYCSDGVRVVILDNRSGYVKEILEQNRQLTEKELNELIERHETISFELKSSFQHSIKKNRKAECLGDQIVKEICAFMNGQGGKICIGVDNAKQKLGLENDYSHLTNIKPGQPKRDAFIQTLRDFVNSRLGNKSAETLYNSYVMSIDTIEVCIVDVKASNHIPIFILEKFKTQDCDADENTSLRNKNKWTFYVRTDRGTAEKNPYEAAQYWQNEKKTRFL